MKYSTSMLSLYKRYIIFAVILILCIAATACYKPAELAPRVSSPPAKTMSENATQVLDQANDTKASIEQEGWQIVQTFTGKDSAITAPFQIQGIKWRFTWAIDAANPEYASFSAFVYPNTSGSLPIKQISSSKGVSSETVYIDSGGQDFYVKVIAANLKSWTIIADDYIAERAINNVAPVQIIYIKYQGTIYPPEPENGLCYTRIEPDEYVEIKNTSNVHQDIRGWVLTNITKGYVKFTFPAFYPSPEAEYMEPTILKPYEAVRVYTDEIHNESGGFCFNFGTGNYWNNETPDTAVLFDTQGNEISRKSYTLRTEDNN